MQINKFWIVIVLIYTFLTNSCFAKCISKDINAALNGSNINKNSVSVSIKSLDTQKVFYELNPLTPMPPASTQKIITTIPAIKTLGEDYKFSTKLYKDKSGNYLIVLGGDPYLTTSDLQKLTSSLPDTIKSISIDDTILDKTEWGEGWQWDDEINPLMPKFSAYNIDRNTINIFLQPTQKDAPVNVFFEKDYPINFVNHILTGDKSEYTVEKKTTEDLDIILGEGVIDKTITVSIPVNRPKKYFKLRLTDVLLDNMVSNSGVFLNKKLTKDYVYITKISHDIKQAKEDILKNSDNYVSETLFKLAGGKFVNGVGSFDSGLKMFDDYCKKIDLDNSGINIVDASGVSKNNLMVTNFMTNFLVINKNEIEPMMATPGEGTLSDRLLYLKGNLKAKTGTLSNVSALAGYVSTQNGHKYAFSIIIQDAKSKSKDKKLLEDSIIKTLYLKG